MRTDHRAAGEILARNDAPESNEGVSNFIVGADAKRNSRAEQLSMRQPLLAIAVVAQPMRSWRVDVAQRIGRCDSAQPADALQVARCCARKVYERPTLIAEASSSINRFPNFEQLLQ